MIGSIDRLKLRSKRATNLVLALTLALTVSGCASTSWTEREWSKTEVGALGGAAAGAGLGAIVGSQSGNAGPGVAIGAAAGALAGGLVGSEFESRDREFAERERRISDIQRELDDSSRLISELKALGVDVNETSRGIVINLPDVLFDFGSARMTSKARKIVSEIAGVIKDTSKSSRSYEQILVEGHTDSVGTISRNYELSVDRANSVSLELENNGINHRMLVTRGFGETDPIASNRTARGRQENRRVEVVIQR